jgi:hypothetical protein
MEIPLQTPIPGSPKTNQHPNQISIIKIFLGHFDKTTNGKIPLQKIPLKKCNVKTGEEEIVSCLEKCQIILRVCFEISLENWIVLL